MALKWRNDHSEGCPVTYWRGRLANDLEPDPENPYLLGAVPEWDEGGDQEAEVCTCQHESAEPIIVRALTLLLPRRSRPW